jgi:hypothetical protein
MIPTAQYPLGVPLPVTHEWEKHPDSRVFAVTGVHLGTQVKGALHGPTALQGPG